MSDGDLAGGTETGVSTCDTFKGKLDEYAQKERVPTPVYETTKEGPHRGRVYRSTVIVNGVKYVSRLGYTNRIAAEHSAAQVALMELAKSGQDCIISLPVHEAELSKSLVQEYATKESSTELSGGSAKSSMPAVILSRKRVLEAPSVPTETTNSTPLAKKARLEKKQHGKKKPKSEVPESGPTEQISNACPSTDGEPGAPSQHMGISIPEPDRLVDSLSLVSVPKEETTNTAPLANEAPLKKKHHRKKKPKSEVPESGPTEQISNACRSTDGEPGAASQHMGISIPEPGRFVDSLSLVSVPTVETTNTTPLANEAGFKKKRHGKKKPKSQVPESGPTAQINNACCATDGQPGAASEDMGISIPEPGRFVESLSLVSVPTEETTNTTPLANEAGFEKKHHGKKKPKTEVTESRPTEQISNACCSTDGQPGAASEDMGITISEPGRFVDSLSLLSVPMEEPPLANEAGFEKKRHGKKKSKSQVPESEPTEQISNACCSTDGQPGAASEDTGISIPEPGRSEEATLVSKTMNTVGLKKNARYSWIFAQKKVHFFQAKDTSHERNSDIQKMMAKLKVEIEATGYIPDISWAPHGSEEERLAEVWHHSEKIAMAFGLMSIPPGLPIEITTNVRICADCHNAFKCFSSMFRRRISVRDCSKLHEFWDGQCSCKDSR